jgi:hypothetical protein
VFAFKDELHLWLRSKAGEGNYLKIEDCLDRHQPEAEKTGRIIARSEQSQPAAVVNASQREIRAQAKSKVQVLESVKAFFAIQSSRQGWQKCEPCESVMQFVDGHFSLYGSGMKWNISLPFCPVCDVGMLECVRQLHSIH